MSCDLNYRIRNIQVIKINGSTQVCPQRGAVLPLEDSHVTHDTFFAVLLTLVNCNFVANYFECSFESFRVFSECSHTHKHKNTHTQTSFGRTTQKQMVAYLFTLYHTQPLHKHVILLDVNYLADLWKF